MSGTEEQRKPVNSMMDKSRITLCMFLLAIFAFNPLSGFFEATTGNDFSSTSQGGSGRTILSEESFMDTVGFSSTSRWLMNMGLHFILFLIVMIKIFIYGEVHVDVKSKGTFL